MIANLQRILLFVACLTLCLPAAGQGSFAQQILTPPGQAPKPNTPADPLGRETPSGTLFGFLHAAQDGNYSTAAQYLQMSASKRQVEGEDLARKLKAVEDRAFVGNLARISDQPEGVPQEGVPSSQQKVGTLAAGDIEVDLILTRVTDANARRIWLISSETLAKVPELYAQAAVHQVEVHLPRVLVHSVLLGMPLWQWLALLAAVPIAAGLTWLLLQLLALPERFWSRYRRHAEFTGWAAASTPLWWFIGTWIHRAMVAFLGMPLLHRHYYQQVTRVVLITSFSWLVWRMAERLMQGVRARAVLSGRIGMGSLMLLGQRLLKALIVIIAVFAVLGTLGFNLTTALAGVGIGGIAIAFAAQKTLENLFGGVSVLGDEVIRVGDFCRFGDRVGTVEDISLRSTRVRTNDRTELSIPNGSLATMTVENFSRRDKILFNTKLALRGETSPDQLRYALAEIRRLLYEHPKVETNGARIRFIGFDAGTLSLEIFCYVLTRDFGGEYLAIQEDLLLRMMDIIQASGTALAFPASTLYLGRDSGLDKEKTAAAAREVQEWKEAGKLPFPDFAAADIASFSNSLPYPPPGSATLGKTKESGA
ncbi:MAG TPA: mechanosensitive ion channel family protein [Terriglobales bacterium]|jgi:MscS family membrane protein|nr:mechanosensitive ion channel family protein [Terriglobales bacterium]